MTEITCKYCGKIKIVKTHEFLRGQHKYCSQSCAAVGKPSTTRFKQTWFGRNCEFCGQFFYNKNRKTKTCAEECQRKLQASKLKCSGKLLGTNNPFYGKHHTEETKVVMSQKKQIYDIKYNTTKQLYKDKWFRSKSEVKFASWCDNNNIEYSYEPQRFALANCSYTPDFYLPDYDYYIEVKYSNVDKVNTQIDRVWKYK
jgi:hypothetical protein